jgi:hypothetical protein
MGIHDYMAVGRKLSMEDDRANVISSLIITTVFLGGCCYFSYHLAKERSKKISWLNQNLDKLKDQSRRQGEAFSKLVEENHAQQQRIIDMERDNQLLAGRLSDKLVQGANTQ